VQETFILQGERYACAIDEVRPPLALFVPVVAPSFALARLEPFLMPAGAFIPKFGPFSRVADSIRMRESS